MAVRISVVPASTQAGRETIRYLLSHESRPHVHGVYRDLSKVPSEFGKHPNFTMSDGDISAPETLDFGGSMAVFYVPPPTYDALDMSDFASRNAENVKLAIEKAGTVHRLVLFSSMGSQYSKDTGILRINHVSDRILGGCVPEVVIPQPGYFQENWAHAFETIQAVPPVFYSPISPADHKIPMVSLIDIGKVCGSKLLEAGQPLASNPQYFKLYGPKNYSTTDVQAAIESVTGKRAQAIVIEKNDLSDFFGQKVSGAAVQALVDMTTAALPGGIMAGDFEVDEQTIQGVVEIEEALQMAYKSWLKERK